MRRMLINRCKRKHGSHFEKHKTAFEEGGGTGAVAEEEQSREDSAGSRVESLNEKDDAEKV